MKIGKTPQMFHRLSGAQLTWYALPFIALLILAGCQVSSSPTTGNDGTDSLLAPDNYSQIEPGEFLMGSPYQPTRLARIARSTNGYEASERPQRRVSITRPFEIGKYEVTQEQWQSVMRSNPSSFKGSTLPVTNVSWNDAMEFIARLQSLDEKHTYRLPTEAEWEYACRAGSSGAFSGEEFKAPEKDKKEHGRTKSNRKDSAAKERESEDKALEEFAKNLQVMGWFSANAFNHPHPVGKLKPNAWGLFDMHGNIREWCRDWFDADHYKSAPHETDQTKDPQGPMDGAMKVNRGGDWQSPASMCRSAARGYALPNERNSLIGFRLVRIKR
ncbi:MAG: formylglycine-generating enzyme family protein [Blastocatellales bacterium]